MNESSPSAPSVNGCFEPSANATSATTIVGGKSADNLGTSEASLSIVRLSVGDFAELA